MNLRIKRVYEPPEKSDGVRILVDRLWPRGLSRDAAQLDHWIRDVAPSTELRKWFGHDPEKWPQFRKRFRAELDAAPESVQALREALGKGTNTLLFAARDEQHNNAVVIRDYLQT
jgi:uncharacterized protein YeaO (DUF488 family)